MIKVSMPLFIELGKNKIKRHYLNFNLYRNWHYQVSNNIKKAYSDLVSSQIQDHKHKKYQMIDLSYTLFKGSRRKSDKANFLSVHEKFFCDALTKYRVIEDDNDDIIHSQIFNPTQIDKENPRVEIEVKVLTH